MLVRYTVEKRRRIIRTVEVSQVKDLEELQLAVERDEGKEIAYSQESNHLLQWEIVPLPHGA